MLFNTDVIISVVVVVVVFWLVFVLREFILLYHCTY
jgi:hypothetical protein